MLDSALKERGTGIDVDPATRAEIEEAMAGVVEEETEAGASGENFLSKADLDWAKRKATGTPYGRQRAQSPEDERAADEYAQVHLSQINKKTGFFRRIANWFNFKKRRYLNKMADELYAHQTEREASNGVPRHLQEPPMR